MDNEDEYEGNIFEEIHSQLKEADEILKSKGVSGKRLTDFIWIIRLVREWDKNLTKSLLKDSGKEETIKVNGYSVGDSSVGIQSLEFSLDTGLIQIDDEDRQFIRKNILKNIEELHDNGKLTYHFSDDDSEW